MKTETVDLSGFEKPPQAKGYERTCQQALWLGVQYLAKVDKPENIFKGTVEFKHITGIAITPESSKELEAIWSNFDKKVWHGWTGAQHQCVVGHLRFIAKNGIEKWLNEFSSDRKFKVDLEELFKEIKN